MRGKIVKLLGGLYTVEHGDVQTVCKAKGIFRKDDEESPVVGDEVEIEFYSDKDSLITKIYPRQNQLIRPPLANIDILFIVVSTCYPRPNFFVLDRLIAICEYKKIEPIIVITKTDLGDCDELKKVYTSAGYKVFCVNNNVGVDEEIKKCIEGKVCAFTGNTGVGKSSLLNNIEKTLNLQTGDISKKLGRGKHTTRHVELFCVANGYVADTPGFSALETGQYEQIKKDELQYCFREFEPYLNKCKFTNCSHTKEKGCAVLDANKNGDIKNSRIESYIKMYDEAKNIKEWEK